jgi:hypothetical protein
MCSPNAMIVKCFREFDDFLFHHVTDIFYNPIFHFALLVSTQVVSIFQ